MGRSFMLDKNLILVLTYIIFISIINIEERLRYSSNIGGLL